MWNQRSILYSPGFNLVLHIQRSTLFLCKFANMVHYSDKTVNILKTTQQYTFRADSRFVPSQWEMLLLCNGFSHWLCASLESALALYVLLMSLLSLSRPGVSDGVMMLVSPVLTTAKLTSILLPGLSKWCKDSWFFCHEPLNAPSFKLYCVHKQILYIILNVFPRCNTWSIFHKQSMCS